MSVGRGELFLATVDRNSSFGIRASVANVVAFFGISYFDQTIIAWYALLAIIAAIAVSVRKAKRNKPEEQIEG